MIKCDRCGRRYRGSGDWNFMLQSGYVIGTICPTCQTPEENAEAVINEATTDYLGMDRFGRVIGRAKVSE